MVAATSAGVYGEVKGLEYAYRKYGSGVISWEDLIKPSIALAKYQNVTALQAAKIAVLFVGCFLILELC